MTVKKNKNILKRIYAKLFSGKNKNVLQELKDISSKFDQNENLWNVNYKKYKDIDKMKEMFGR